MTKMHEVDNIPKMGTKEVETLRYCYSFVNIFGYIHTGRYIFKIYYQNIINFSCVLVQFEKSTHFFYMEKYRISLQHKNKHQDPTHFIQAYLEIIKKIP